MAPAPEELTCNVSFVRVTLERANAVERAIQFFSHVENQLRLSEDVWGHYFEADIALRIKWVELVERVRRSGCLLHLGWVS